MKGKKIEGFLTKSFMRRMVVRSMMITLSFLLFCIIVLTCVLMMWSSGKTKPFVDKNKKVIPGSISEKTYVNINGVKQGMFIKGKDRTKPILLFLHGGPGMPEYAISQKYTTVLENFFIVCWWEQRGSGLSYASNISPKTMTIKQMISDTVEVTNYLRNRFGVEKIYLMGHSWGTFIGIQAAKQAPELYYAYIAMSQMSRQLESEKLAYKYMVEQFKLTGNKKMLKKIENYSINDVGKASLSYGSLRDECMHSLGVGTTHNMKSVIAGIFLPIMQNKEYTLGEKINIWRGKYFSENYTNLWNNMMTTDLTKEVHKLDIPVYFCGGIYDYTVSYSEAKKYFNKLTAPIKGFYTFNHSAHSPMFEEPKKFIRILKEDVLTGTNNLADSK